jgi:hypothetical protein
MGCNLVAKQYGAGSRRGFNRSRVDYPTWYNEMRIVSRCTGERRYSYIRFYGPPTLETPVWVWCSCPFFAYNVEWVLTQYGSSSVSTGYQDRGVAIKNKPPTIRNSEQRPYLCKHLMLCADQALRQTRELSEKESRQGVVETPKPKRGPVGGTKEKPQPPGNVVDLVKKR